MIPLNLAHVHAEQGRQGLAFGNVITQRNKKAFDRSADDGINPDYIILGKAHFAHGRELFVFCCESYGVDIDVLKLVTLEGKLNFTRFHDRPRVGLLSLAREQSNGRRKSEQPG